jgi:hypothetical protein
MMQNWGIQDGVWLHSNLMLPLRFLTCLPTLSGNSGKLLSLKATYTLYGAWSLETVHLHGVGVLYLA